MESKVVEPQPVERRKLYRANDDPQWPLAVLFGFQQVMVCVSALLVIPFILADELCAGSKINELRVQLISSTFVASGFSTIIQTAFGMRLALLQGTAFAYIPSVQAFLALPENKCNFTIEEDVPREQYETKLALIQGCLLLSSLVPMLIGFSGLVGVLTRFIGPITVTPLILLLVMSAVPLSIDRMEVHWVSLIQLAALFATILYLAEVRVPIPGMKDGLFHWYRLAIFGEYPYLIAILVSWGLCFIFTVTDVFSADSAARTDKNTSIITIQRSPWFRLPYPAQFGLPRFNMGLFVAFLISALTSVFESVGDYHAIARVSHEHAPPSHAINRGILVEGCGSFISGLIGPGVGLTTHTENIGVISVTQVASRRTMVLAGVILVFLGICTKIGAILSTIPAPLVGGVLATSMAMVGGVALANIHCVDLQNSRNISIMGVAIMLGLLVPEFHKRHPSITIFENSDLNKIMKVLMNLPMFVGAFTACVLDNTVPGATRRQRGLREHDGNLKETLHNNVIRYDEKNEEHSGRNCDIYALPSPLTHLIECFTISRNNNEISERGERSSSGGVLTHAFAFLLNNLPIIPPESKSHLRLQYEENGGCRIHDISKMSVTTMSENSDSTIKTSKSNSGTLIKMPASDTLQNKIR